MAHPVYAVVKETPVLRCMRASVCSLPTQRGVPAHVGDGARDAALAHARGAGLVSGEHAVCRGRRGAERLGCLGSG